MFGFGKLRFKGIDKKYINDEAHIEDYKSAEDFGRIRFGKLCLYYRDLGVKYYVPYDYIDRSFCRVSTVEPDDSPAICYYRIILQHGETEFANLIYDKEKDADAVIDKFKADYPSIAIGYIPPADGKYRPRFK